MAANMLPREKLSRVVDLPLILHMCTLAPIAVRPSESLHLFPVRAAHFLVPAICGVILVPAFWIQKLPLHIDWPRFLGAYWGGLGVRALFTASVLFVIGFPTHETLRPMWARYRAQRVRILILAIFVVAMVWEFGWQLGGMVVVDGLVITELMDRTSGSLESISKILRAIFWPAVYLFCGLVAMFCYNDLIASLKFIGAYDWMFLKADAWLLHGSSVSQIAHLAADHASIRAFDAAEFVYYGMFGQIGAALILLSVCLGKGQSCRYVSSILSAYALAVLIFYIWPSMGPFYTCQAHFAHFPKTLETYGIQQNAMLKAKLLMTSYKHFNTIGTDYFIAFPCMHIAQPLVVLWYLRRWRRIAACLIAYDLVLLPAILILEWHYLIDIVGGGIVAMIAIAITSSHFSSVFHGSAAQQPAQAL